MVLMLLVDQRYIQQEMSDEDKGLIKFCSNNYLVQFFCIKYIIGKIGAKTVWGKLIGKLLMTYTEEEFNTVHEKNINFANGYYNEKLWFIFRNKE